MPVSIRPNRTVTRERGAVLLLSLFVMSGVTIAAVGMSALIIGSLQQSRVIDNAIIAYYAAETGIEDAIYRARLTGNLPTSQSSPQFLSSGTSWTRAVTDRESVIYAGAIPEDGTYEIALYDPDAPTAAQNIGRVLVTWEDDCSGCTVLQANLVGWTSGGAVLWDPNAETSLHTWNASGVSLTMPDPSRLYRLRLHALEGRMRNVQIRAYDGSNAQTTLPGRIRVDSVGSYANVRQRITATMPRNVPLSGIFDFVIFSECSLVKGGAISCP